MCPWTKLDRWAVLPHLATTTLFFVYTIGGYTKRNRLPKKSCNSTLDDNVATVVQSLASVLPLVVVPTLPNKTSPSLASMSILSSLHGQYLCPRTLGHNHTGRENETTTTVVVSLCRRVRVRMGRVQNKKKKSGLRNGSGCSIRLIGNPFAPSR